MAEKNILNFSWRINPACCPRSPSARTSLGGVRNFFNPLAQGGHGHASAASGGPLNPISRPTLALALRSACSRHRRHNSCYTVGCRDLAWDKHRARNFRVCGLACKRTYHQQIINNGFPEGFSLAKVFLFFILGPIMVIYVLVARYGTLSSKGFCAPFFAVKCRDLTGLRIIKLLILMMVLD